MLNQSTSDFQVLYNIVAEADSGPSSVTDEYFNILRTLLLTGNWANDITMLTTALLDRYEQIETVSLDEEYWIYGWKGAERELIQYLTFEHPVYREENSKSKKLEA
jgi:hypothetical protein